jgi:predicted secreted protein
MVMGAPGAMRRLAFLVLAAPFLLPAAEAAEPGAPAAATETVLHLSETAEKMVRRDRLRVELRVEATGANPRSIQADINRRMAAALERVRAVPTVKSETGTHSVWEERPQNAPPRWRGAQSVVLTGRETGELLQLVGDLQGDGLALSSMQHELAPETSRALEDELTKAALDRIRARAEKVAEAMGLAIIRWKELRVGNASGQGPRPPVPVRAVMQAEAAAMPAPVAEPGEGTVRLTVEVDVVLEPVDPKRP